MFALKTSTALSLLSSTMLIGCSYAPAPTPEPMSDPEVLEAKCSADAEDLDQRLESLCGQLELPRRPGYLDLPVDLQARRLDPDLPMLTLSPQGVRVDDEWTFEEDAVLGEIARVVEQAEVGRGYALAADSSTRTSEVLAIMQVMYERGLSRVHVVNSRDEGVFEQLDVRVLASVDALESVSDVDRRERALEDRVEHAIGDRCDPMVSLYKAASHAPLDDRCAIVSRALPETFEGCSCSPEVDIVIASLLLPAKDELGARVFTFTQGAQELELGASDPWNKSYSTFIGEGDVVAPAW
jgi:hypothetical protein